MIKLDDDNFETKFVPQIYGGYKILPWAFALEGLRYSQKTELVRRTRWITRIMRSRPMH